MNILSQAQQIAARKWRTTGTVAKVFLSAAITAMCVVGLICFVIWGVVRLLKSLSISGTRNMSLYYPAARRRSR